MKWTINCLKEGVAIGTSIMNQSRVERHFGVEDKVLYLRALIKKGTTVNRRLRAAQASFQLAVTSFLNAIIISVPRGRGALNNRLGYQRSVLFQNGIENSVLLITKCSDITGRLIIKVER